MTSWWRRLVGGRTLERQLDAELRDHVERQVADYRRAGLTEAQARRRTTLELGGVEQAKEECRDARGTRLVEELVRDLRYAGRTLRKSPGFTTAALLLLALGIGANTAIFSLLESVLLRRVPVSSPEELYFVAHRHGERTHATSNYAFLERLRDRTDVFVGVTGYTITTFTVSDGDDVDHVNGEYVAGNYHGLLGARFALGRGFSNEDDKNSARSLVAVIGDRYWSRRFGRRPDVLGQTIIVDGRTLSVVGVTAPGFEGLTPGRPSDITLPLSVKTLSSPDYLTMHDTWTSLPLVARVTRGLTDNQASVVIDQVFQQYLSEPENQWYKADAAFLLPADHGSAELRARYSSSLMVLMAIVAVVFLIALANLANLQLARAASRAREMSLRLSIGAGRGRLVRQLLVESLVLSVAGGVLGLLLAFWGTAVITSEFRGGRNPVVLNVEANTIVLAFTAALSLLTGLVFGLAPAIRATSVDLVSSLKHPSSWGRHDRPWGFRRLLVVGQVGLCLLLVTGAGLLVRTLGNLQAPHESFSGTDVVLFSLSGRSPDVSDDFWPRWCGDVLSRLNAHQEIEATACSTSTPVDMSESRRGAVAGSTPITGGVLANVVSPEFFRTFRIPLIRGRTLTAQDSPTAQPVAVINQRMAQLAFGDADPIGRTFHFRVTPRQQIAIVGVVRDVRHNLRESASPTVYTPLGQGGEIEEWVTLAVRSRRDLPAVAAVVRSATRSVRATVLLGRPRTFDEQIAGLLVRERTLALLSGWFGMLALALSCIGLYGVLSYDITRRRRDIGIRLALGADASRVLREVLRETVALVLVGLVLGTGAVLAATTALSDLLFEISPRDPLTLVTAAASLVVTSLLAAYLPARRAARVDPALALRLD